MTRKWILMLGVLGALTVSAGASAPAFAAEWKVEAKPLSGPHKVAESTTTLKNWVLKTSGGIEITCTAVKLKSAVIEAPNKGKGPGLTFGGCKVTSAEKTCEIPGETITTKEVTTATVESGTNDATTFTPTVEEEGRKVFTTIVIKSKPEQVCGVAKSAKVTGTATGDTVKSEAEKEQKKHKLAFTGSSGSALKLGSETATFTGEGELALEPEENWSFR